MDNRGLDGLGQYNNGQQYNGQQYNGQQYNGQQKVSRKRRKIKKKHRFLKFVLFCLVAYLGYRGSSIVLDSIAEKEMAQFVSDYPFVFSDETNRLWYVTDDISVPNTYTVNDKQYKVSWSSNNKGIQVSNNENESLININRPSNYSLDVELVETYKKLWGKAIRSYTITVIPTSSIEDVNVITVDDISSENYNRDMQAVYDKDNNLKYMMGDFKDTFINSSDDALILLEAYKEQFTDEENLEFKFNGVTNIGIYITYKFDIYRNSIKYDTDSASVVVTKSDNKLNKISIDIHKDNSVNQLDSNKLTVDEILERLTSVINTIDSNIVTEEDYVVYSLYEAVNNSQLVYIIDIMSLYGVSYELEVNANTGELVDYKSLMSDSNEESVSATSKDERGNELTFDATLVKPGWLGFLKDEEYILKDQNRNIHAYNNEGWWGLFKEAQKAANKKDPNFLEQIGDVFVMLGGMGDYYIENMIRTEIVSDSSTFDDGISAQAYSNLQTVYEWYKNNLGIISFDGNGKEVVLRNHVKFATDNASWDSGTKTFVVNPSNLLKYSVGMHLEVMGHEYTHAVFQYAGVKLSGGGEEIGGLSEAYGDIMGTIIAQNDSWVICDTALADGTPKAMRDLKNINRAGLLFDLKYPEVYHGENWTGEEHNICPIIGHIAYEMKENGGFTWDDLANIWYNSLGLGYDNSSTFVTCRKYIIKTAEDLGYSDKQVDFIAKAFDDREIFDPSYEFKTTESDINDTEASDGSTTKKTESNAVVGDPILDDSNSHRFIVAYSIIGSVLGKEAIVIYEEADTMSKEEQSQFGDKIAQSFKEQDLTDINGDAVKIEYRQLKKYQMDFAERFCSKSVSYMKGIAYEAIGTTPDDDFGEAKEMLEYIMSICFDWQMTNSTAYDFYDKLGIIK